MEEEIDPMLRDLIAGLNAAGFETFCSCQGKTCGRDYEGQSHCDRAFVTFSATLVRKVAARARALGLGVSLRNRFITSLVGDERGHAEVIAKNLAFPAKMRELFGLLPP